MRRKMGGCLRRRLWRLHWLLRLHLRMHRRSVNLLRLHRRRLHRRMGLGRGQLRRHWRRSVHLRLEEWLLLRRRLQLLSKRELTRRG